jgi:uncharacterized sporulation protein YeaH/YhbH (DUF444 family)
MPIFIDRRLNPRDKHSGDRMRLKGRLGIRKLAELAIKGRKVGGKSGESVTISGKDDLKGISEPRFRLGSKGNFEKVLPGNKDFVSGDQIERPKGKADSAGNNGGGDSDNDSEDPFTFEMSEREFQDLLFEHLELPALVRKALGEEQETKLHRAGYATDGTTPNINVLRTMRNALGRKMALGRPPASAIEKAEGDIAAAIKANDSEALVRARRRLAELEVVR